MTKPRICTPMPVGIQSFPKRDGWTESETKELAHTETRLQLAGLRVELDVGVSDEGDPWCVVCRRGGNEVLAHFARIDGSYIGHWRGGACVQKSVHLNAVTEQFLNSYPCVMRTAELRTEAAPSPSDRSRQLKYLSES
jgi:hypothetical protein